MPEVNCSPIILPRLNSSSEIERLGVTLAAMAEPRIPRFIVNRGNGRFRKCDFQDVSHISDAVNALRSALSEVMEGSGFELTDGIGDMFTVHRVVAGQSFARDREMWHGHEPSVLVLRWDDLVQTACIHGTLELPADWKDHSHESIEEALRASTHAREGVVPAMTPAIFGVHAFHKANLPLGSGGRPIVQWGVQSKN